VYKEDGAQILRHSDNSVLCIILHVTSFLLSERRDIRTEKSRLKCEVKFDLY